MSVTQETSRNLVIAVTAARTWLLTVNEEVARHRPAADRWSLIEVLGHLVDSACNNHQRFIRAQVAESLTFPKYDQNSWVTLNAYQNSGWHQLIEFWYLYNLHLSQVIGGIPSEQLMTPCTITPYERCSLEFLVIDYLDHLNHHLAKMHERVDAA